jgi:hypothetical protein
MFSLGLWPLNFSFHLFMLLQLCLGGAVVCKYFYQFETYFLYFLHLISYFGILLVGLTSMKSNRWPSGWKSNGMIIQRGKKEQPTATGLVELCMPLL